MSRPTITNGALHVPDGFAELVIEHDPNGRIRFTVLHACTPIAAVTASPDASAAIAAFIRKEDS
ncbi:hypothetical protein ACIBQ0_16960 [Nocardia nova]|uniref:hypothetical protein n=1 Tax=Nocardia nova TaxID=37330 RepID=UPI002739DA01|nr:hypothetical protein [Nocardia nova]